MATNLIETDFQNDWIDFLSKELFNHGFDKSSLPKREDISNYHFNFMIRKIPSIPRAILKADTFIYPNQNRDVLLSIEAKIEFGEDLTCYLSDKIDKLRFDDDLLNDWGIHHLHLGSNFEHNPKFIKRTSELLFVRFSDAKAYFIGVYDHKSWTKQELIEIIHRNWPESIEKFRIKGINGISRIPTEQDIYALRKGHVNYVIKIEPDNFYIPIGDGVMLSGVSSRAAKWSLRYERRVDEFETYLQKNIRNILADRYDKQQKLKFRLQIEEGCFYAFGLDLNLKIKLGRLYE